MKIIADTNLILRFFLTDDPAQHRSAVEVIRQAEAVIIPSVTLCEFAWVLRSRYRASRSDIASAMMRMRDASYVVMPSAAFDGGMSVLEAGADFADGVIAYEGRWLGGEMFVSFDKKAVSAIEREGNRAMLLEA